jgi:glycosyltransferase involved in cell wall biosynthesis
MKTARRVLPPATWLSAVAVAARPTAERVCYESGARLPCAQARGLRPASPVGPHSRAKDATVAYHSHKAVKLSVLMPVYNEARTIDQILRLVAAVPIEKEVLVVDDGSTDGSRDIVRSWNGREGVRAIFHETNQGKGRALATAIGEARGEILLIQDADLEYDPADYPAILRPIETGRADVVFGSRFRGSAENRVQNFWHTVGNRILTLIANVFTDLNLTDMATCYKAFHQRVVPSLQLESKRFGVDAEITVKVARGGFRIFEVPVAYFARSRAEGKKIRLRDGFAALAALVRFSLAERSPH